MSNSVQDPAQAQQHAEGAVDDKYGKGKSRMSDDSGMEDDEEEDEDYEEVRHSQRLRARKQDTD